MDKVYAVFPKSDHPIGKLTEPVKIFSTKSSALLWSNSQALQNGSTYTIGEYEVADEEIRLPDRIIITALYSTKLKELIEILEIKEEDYESFPKEDKDSDRIRTDFFPMSDTEEDPCKIVAHMPVSKNGEKAYETTIEHFMDFVKDLH